MEFTFKYSSPERALMRKQSLEAEIGQYDADIASIQSQRAEALDELAALQTMLMQNGHTTINIQQKVLEAAIAQQLPAANEQKPAPATKNLPEYNNAWSLRVKMIYAYLLVEPKAEWTTDDIKFQLQKLEPNNDKIKNVSTIIGQCKNDFIRINKNESKPLYKLAKGTDRVVLDLLV